jgi:hypothetical protein
VVCRFVACGHGVRQATVGDPRVEELDFGVAPEAADAELGVVADDGCLGV